MSQRLSSIIISIITILLFICSAPALAGDRFIDNGDGTVTDHKLGVMWAKTDNHGDIDGLKRIITEILIGTRRKNG